METIKVAAELSALVLLSLLLTANAANDQFQTVSVQSACATEFIKSNCRATRYPVLCLQSLSAYAHTIQKSHRQLASSALSVSLARALSTKAFVAKLLGEKGMKAQERAALKDCVESLSDGVDRLGQSVQEMGRVIRSNKASFEWHMSNVQTWASAALTDANTCLDGLAGPAVRAHLKAAVKGRVVNVAQVTSNALALVNRFAGRAKAP